VAFSYFVYERKNALYCFLYTQTIKKKKKRRKREEQRERKLYFIYNQGTNQIGSLAGAKKGLQTGSNAEYSSFVLIPWLRTDLMIRYCLLHWIFDDISSHHYYQLGQSDFID
jgi:hypothetical protein